MKIKIEFHKTWCKEAFFFDLLPCVNLDYYKRRRYFVLSFSWLLWYVRISN